MAIKEKRRRETGELTVLGCASLARDSVRKSSGARAMRLMVSERTNPRLQVLWDPRYQVPHAV